MSKKPSTRRHGRVVVEGNVDLVSPSAETLTHWLTVAGVEPGRAQLLARRYHGSRDKGKVGWNTDQGVATWKYPWAGRRRFRVAWWRYDW